MKRAANALRTSLAILVAALLIADSAAADPAAQLLPVHLRVSEGEENWHADDDHFQLNWDRPPIAEQGFPITAVDYRVRNAAGTVVTKEIRLPGDKVQIDNAHLPDDAAPGVYTADIWLEGPGGQRGPTGECGAALR